MTLTPRGTSMLAAAGLSWGVGRLLGVPELFVVSVAVLALLGLGAVAVLAGGVAMSVQRDVATPRLPFGQRTEVSLRIRSEGRLPTPLLLVEERLPYRLGHPARFSLASLPAGRSVRVRYELTGSLRGRYEVGPLSLRVRDPFGLAERVIRDPRTEEVVVYPRLELLSTGVGRGAHRGSGTSESSRLFDQGDEFYTMREYVSGDDLRLVHWPSTAHRQKLMVRQQEQPWEAQATVLLDSRAITHPGTGPTASIETAVSAAASVVWHLADHRYQLRLVTPDTGRTHGVEDWGRILDRLAPLAPSMQSELAPALLRLRGAGAEGLLVAVLGSELSAGDIRALLLTGRSFSGRAALVVGSPGQAGRPEQVRDLLAANGWRCAVVEDSIASAWDSLLASPVRRTVAR